MTTKRNKWEGWKSGNAPQRRIAPANHEVDVSSLFSNMSRRKIMQQAALASLSLAVPWADRAFAATPAIPKINYLRNKTGDGIIGPFGEARIYNVAGQLLPMRVTANNGYAMMDVGSRAPFVRIGAATDTKAITLSASGVQYGTAKPLAWNAVVARDVVKAIISDPVKMQGALHLRSALHTSYPVACKQLQPKLTMGKKMAAVMAKGSVGMGVRVMNPTTSNCSIQTVTETVTTTITTVVQRIMTAFQQAQACYEARLAGTCKGNIWPEACAALTCGVDAFVDMVVDTITIIDVFVEEVTREVMVCTAPQANRWPNPFGPSPTVLQGAIAQKPQKFDIVAALSFLKSQLAFLGPYARCLLDGKWELAELNTQLNLGGEVVVPYGVRVCISTKCAEQLALQGIGMELINNWLLLLQALAALSPAFAVKAAAVGIIPLAALAGIVATESPVIIGTAAIILAVIILLMIQATVLGAELTVQLALGAGSDGIVCIEHPTFALALIAIPLLGFGGLNLAAFPPIVTG